MILHKCLDCSAQISVGRKRCIPCSAERERVLANRFKTNKRRKLRQQAKEDKKHGA